MSSSLGWPRHSPDSGSLSDDGDRDRLHTDGSTSPRPSTDSSNYPPHTPGLPRSPTSSEPLLTMQDLQLRSPTRSFSATKTVGVSSPLNPNPGTHMLRGENPFASRPNSRANSLHFNRIASEESHAFGSSPFTDGHRGSMILYRLASEGATDSSSPLAPPRTTWAASNRDSLASSSRDSVWSVSSDSKYLQNGSSMRGLVPYVYDPMADLKDADDDEDFLHDPRDTKHEHTSYSPWRAIANVGVLILLVLGLMCLFILYPVLTFIRSDARNFAIDNNIHINSTGQAAVMFGMPELIDVDTPDSAKTRTGFDGEDYELVFSDEFNIDGRSFYPGDDPYWEAADLWYWATNDTEWYDPSMVTTAGGNLVIMMDSVEDITQNHGLQYKSGMLQSWNKFCFTTGYIEVALTLPGPDQNTQGYWPGAWTMGNLGRPGYGATTDGTWPYTYDSCDVGTFPNQTLKDGSGPAAAVHSDQSKTKYDFKLSVLSGQRLSSCTCAGEDHPGPSVSKGRGAPEIDIIEAEKDKNGPGQVVSQSFQAAPFTHDYLYTNDTADAWTVYDTSLTRPNSYKGSAVQQAVSALTTVPENMFQGSGQVMTVFGFEYWADPDNRDDGFITWVSDGKPSARMGASAVGPDTGADGTGVGQRLVSEEPMSIVLNMGISTNWQKILLETMEFPAQMLVDYVRVYQRKGQTNVGCDPKDYPTADYINRHMDAYTNANWTGWTSTTVPDTQAAGYPWPKNSLYDGC